MLRNVLRASESVKQTAGTLRMGLLLLVIINYYCY